MTDFMETSASNVDMLKTFDIEISEAEHIICSIIINSSVDGNMEALIFAHKFLSLLKNTEGFDEDISSLCIWNEKTCEVAAYNRNINVLKYLHETKFLPTDENGYPWNSKTCTEAVRYNPDKNSEFLALECLTYAYENGCPLDESIIYTCISSGYLDCLKYILEQEDCCWSTETCIIVNNELLENESITEDRKLKIEECLEYFSNHVDKYIEKNNALYTN